MSDTPRTDKAEKECVTDGQLLEFARNLQREVNALKNKVKVLEGSNAVYQKLSARRSAALQNIVEEASEALK